MCFSENNSYFITQKLYSEMKGLSDSEKLEKYLVLKDDVYKRLKNSYTNCDLKINFYKDAFEVLGFYEAEYLMCNLFFEDNCALIITSLIKQKVFRHITIHFHNVDSIGYDFYNYIFNKLDFTNQDLIEFLKGKSIEVTQTISEFDWKDKNINSHPLVNKYAIFFTQVNNENIKTRVYGFYLFVKIWNYFDGFSNPFNNTKGILFFNNLNSFCKENGYNDFYLFYNQMLNSLGLLFCKFQCVLFDDRTNSEILRKGFRKKRKGFFKFMELQLKRNNTTFDNTFFQLIINFTNNQDKELKAKCKSIISEKLQNLQYPNNQNIQRIKKLSVNKKQKNQIEKIFFDKLYLY